MSFRYTITVYIDAYCGIIIVHGFHDSLLPTDLRLLEHFLSQLHLSLLVISSRLSTELPPLTPDKLCLPTEIGPHESK